MFREVDFDTAFMKYRTGAPGMVYYADGRVQKLEEAFQLYENARFVVDFEEDPGAGLNYAGSVYSKVKLPEVPEASIKAETPEKPKWKRQTPQEARDEEQAVLKAWNGGERSIQQIMDMTGYSRYIVRKYIPISEKG